MTLSSQFNDPNSISAILWIDRTLLFPPYSGNEILIISYIIALDTWEIAAELLGRLVICLRGINLVYRGKFSKRALRLNTEPCISRKFAVESLILLHVSAKL